MPRASVKEKAPAVREMSCIKMIGVLVFNVGSISKHYWCVKDRTLGEK